MVAKRPKKEPLISRPVYINSCLYYILEHFIKNKKLNNDNISNVLFKSYKFYRFYNNNYRPIYHLEKFLYYLCKVVHEF